MPSICICTTVPTNHRGYPAREIPGGRRLNVVPLLEKNDRLIFLCATIPNLPGVQVVLDAPTIEELRVLLNTGDRLNNPRINAINNWLPDGIPDLPNTVTTWLEVFNHITSEGGTRPPRDLSRMTVYGS